MGTQSVTIDALVHAPRGAAWKAYTDPDHITQWNFADDSWHCPSASNDLRVGGKLKSRMEAKDGSFGFDFEGTYEQVTQEQSLTYVLDDGRAVTTTFEDTDEGTLVTTTFDAETENDVEMQRGGWQAILNNYKAHAEAM